MTAVDRVGSADAPVASGEPSESTAPPAGWWGVGLALIGACVGAGALADNSFLTHLATGRLAWESGVPQVDPYSFSAAGDDWVVSSWLASWVYALGEKIGGLGAVRVLVATATALTVGLLWRLTAPARGVLIRVGLVALVVVLSVGWFSERPQIFAFAAVAALLVVLAEKRSIWWAVPIGAIWVNVHASWPLGIIVLGLWFGSSLLDRRTVDRHTLDVSAVFGTAAILGAAVSPFGFRLLSFPFVMLGKSDTLQFIKEWRRPEPTDPHLVMFVAAVAVGVLLCVRHRRVGSGLALLALVGPVAMGIRNLPVASMVLVALVAPLLKGLGDERIGPVARPRQMAAVGAIGALVVGALIVATPDLDLSPYPVSAVDWMDQEGYVATENLRVLSYDYVGNYLEFRFGNSANVWNDDRAEVIPHRVFADYVELLSKEPQPQAWAEILDRNDIDKVLWRDDDPFGEWLTSDDARVVEYHEDGWVVVWLPRLTDVG